LFTHILTQQGGSCKPEKIPQNFSPDTFAYIQIIDPPVLTENTGPFLGNVLKTEKPMPDKHKGDIMNT